MVGAELDQLECFGAVEGDLTIRDAESLSALESVTAWEGSLIIEASPDLLTLQGLGMLSEVGGDLRIVGTGITSLAGMEQLREVSGELEIADNDALNSLLGLELTLLGGGLIVDDCGSLTDLNDPILPAIIGDLQILNNESLTSLDGVEELRQIQSLVITDNPALANLTSLCGLDPSQADPAGISGAVATIIGNGPLTETEARCVVESATPFDGSVASDISGAADGSCSCN